MRGLSQGSCFVWLILYGCFYIPKDCQEGLLWAYSEQHTSFLEESVESYLQDNFLLSSFVIDQ